MKFSLETSESRDFVTAVFLVSTSSKKDLSAEW